MPSSWVTARTGTRLDVPAGVVELALRRNPRRAHLLVSLLLGKHVPVPAADVLGAADRLGRQVAALVPGEVAVLGFAETATALGHGVARALGAPYAHTTRRPLPPGVDVLRFEEEHSHAVDQTLAVVGALADPARALVLVDDELSTGRTAVNAIRVLQARWPRRRYVLASLLDLRCEGARDDTRAQVDDLGAELLDISLFTGQVHLPADLLEQAGELVACATQQQPVRRKAAATVREWRLALPCGTPLTAALGWDALAEAGLAAAMGLAARELAPEGSVLVLGDEELMYPAQLLAQAAGPDVRTSSTTRSPVLVVDAPGYPVRTALRFGAVDDPDRPAFAYNVAASGCGDRGPAPGFDTVVLVLDREPSAQVRGGLLDQLAAVTRRRVEVVVLHTGSGPEPCWSAG